MGRLVRLMSFWATIVLAGSLGIAVPANASPLAANWAGATRGRGCSALNMADNNVHTYANVNVSVVYSPAVYSTAKYVDDLPQMDSMYRVGSLTANTDVVFRDGGYTSYCGFNWLGGSNGGTLVGLTECFSINTAGECEKHQIRLSTIWGDDASLTWRTALVTHETGHSLGLVHRNAGVMETPLTGSASFTGHDKNHLWSL